MEYTTWVCTKADILFQGESKLNNYQETHVSVRNDGDTISVEPICKNEWGSRYDIYGLSISIPVSLIPEEIRANLPAVGDWHDVSLWDEE